MLDALTLDQIRTFVTIADSGSFRSAAGRLGRVQSGVSVAIANLEAQLGVALFDRTGHRPLMTREGEALLANARDILLRVDAMRARARGLGEGVELELPLAVDTLYPIHHVGQALAELRTAFPLVSVRLVVEPLGGPLTALRERRCTLAIMVGEEFRDPRITFEALSSISQVAVVAADHRLAGFQERQSIGIPDLADHVQVVLSDPSQVSKGRDFGVISPQTCRVGSQDAKHALILAGVGWGRLPLWLVQRDLEGGRLRRLGTGALGRNAEVVSETYLAHRLDEPLGPAARKIAEILVRTSSNDSNP
ncbi:LysR family transcriptional regulator [Tabrizicola sp.]|uniref:LysR family transcriptional regulator n=1 Tax=Tabrizicola sp. TaxID=2005166 RepID=UPI003F34E37C